MKIKTRTTCRICNSKLIDVVDLGNQTLGNKFLFPEDKKPPLAPLELVRCDGKNNDACRLVQLRHTIPARLLYTEYWYCSGINQTMRKHLANIAKKAEKIARLKSGDTVLDIGCNDGTLLGSYTTKRIKRIGIDPAKNIVTKTKKYDIKIVNDFFSSSVFFKVSRKRAKIITSIAMFYDLEDPNKFVSDIKQILHEDGLWVMEQSYLPMMLNLNSFDTICHEHLEYYSLAPIDFMLMNNGLEAVDVEFNDVNGGSFRVYIMHKGKKEQSKRLLNARKREKLLNLSSDKPYKVFRNNINRIRTGLISLIKSEHNLGKKIFVYGSSTKGNTILQFCNLNNEIITAAADKNPDKWGRLTPGTNIPIISEEEARNENPDYFLVLPWHFLNEFVIREKKYFESGGKFIVPLPEVKIIDKSIL